MFAEPVDEDKAEVASVGSDVKATPVGVQKA